MWGWSHLQDAGGLRMRRRGRTRRGDVDLGAGRQIYEVLLENRKNSYVF